MARNWVSPKYPEVRFRYLETHGDEAGCYRNFSVQRRVSRKNQDQATALFPSATADPAADTTLSGRQDRHSRHPESRAATPHRGGYAGHRDPAERHDADSSSQEIKSFQLIPDRSTITVVSCWRSVA